MNLPFAEYISRCRETIAAYRTDLVAINANSPFELYPPQPILASRKLKYGVLLIHGLLDCPFSLKDIGLRLQAQGILSRAILLPGHGVRPSDLLHVSYQDWIDTVRYGIDSLRQEVEHIFLIGYSTGAALSIYQALQNTPIDGIVLLSPAIRIKAPVHLVVSWHYLTKWIRKNNHPWVYNKKEIDYAKYKSIAFNPVNQVSALTDVLQELRHHPLSTPMLMILSRDDETISSHKAINFFSKVANADSELLLYSSKRPPFDDPRIKLRPSHYPEWRIQNFSHMSIPFAPDNPHYGQQGDYIYASHPADSDFIFGAYNPIEEDIYALLYQRKLVKHKRRELTYNPDFDFMAERIKKFILGT
ncbi:MAG: hypothetical protein EPO11_03190 [Gammaproteobacteria bacterium]|nr:MAG: hypothetical protein EPO11_03190 [Gammaproteobacteria bacterium]